LKINVVLGPFLAPPPAPCGAIERLWDDLAAEFARRGHHVTLTHRSHHDVDAVPARDGVRRLPVRGFQSTGRLAVNIALDSVYALRVALAAPRADITVGNSFSLPLLLPIFRRKFGSFHVHVQRVPKGQVRLYLLAGADRFAAVSSYIANCLREEAAAAAPLTRVFPNPINTAAFRPREDHRKPCGPPIVSYAGRIHPEKGIEVLLEAARLLRAERPELAFHVRIAGPWQTSRGGGGAAYRRHLGTLARGLPVSFFRPIYNRDSFARYLLDSHVFCYPSLAEKGEASPVAPLEAMACGVPVVLSNLGQFRDYFEPSTHGWSFEHRTPDRARNLATCLREALSMEAAPYAGVSARCAARGRDFDTATVADAYLRDFEQLLKDRLHGHSTNPDDDTGNRL
jgi:glycosyltransferase involved in cell wall biosynthesis